VILLHGPGRREHAPVAFGPIPQAPGGFGWAVAAEGVSGVSMSVRSDPLGDVPLDVVGLSKILSLRPDTAFAAVCKYAGGPNTGVS
jgi:hypothetical protein